MIDIKNKIIAAILIVIVTMSMLVSAGSGDGSGIDKVRIITMTINPVKSPTNIPTQIISGSGFATGCGDEGIKYPLQVTVNGLPANIVGDPLFKTMTFSRSISLSEGENTITVTATIGPHCSITKTTTIRLDTTPPPTGSISVTTNLSGATFSLTGASSYSGSGTSWSTANAPAGTYTITYGTVTGYNTPPSETKTLSAGGSIAFSGTYTLTPATTGTISVTTNLAGATFSVTGASSFSGNGTSWSTANAPAGTYTITYGTVTGYNTPPSETKTLSGSGSIAFSGTYVPKDTTKGFEDDFNSQLLDPSWQVIEKVPGLGRYSLTDNPGYLRYYLEGSQGSMWGWNNNYQTSGAWRPSLTLIRPFDGENWNLTAKVNYNLHAHISGGSTGAQGQGFYIALGEGTNDYIYIYRGVDWWYSSNVFYMELVSNGVSVAKFNGAPSSVGADGWVRESYWYEITRDGQKITVSFSNDGIKYTTAFSALLTQPVTTTQRAIIDMNLWNGVGSYVDWDYIHVVVTSKPTAGSILVISNLLSATFTLTGASSYSGSMGSFTIDPPSWNTANATAGTYTITYGAVTGYNTPPSETKTLTAGGNIAFNGTYTLTPEPPQKDNALYAEKRTVVVNESVLVPLNIKNATNIGNMDILLTYDPNVVKATKVQKGSLTSDTIFDSNVQVAGEIRISFASTQGIKGDGSIAFIEFQAIGSPGSTSPVTLVEAFANEAGTMAKLNAALSHGEVRISEIPLLKGDVNGDGVVSAADALMALKMSVGRIPAKDAADVNGDGRVTSADAGLILQAATGKITL